MSDGLPKFNDRFNPGGWPWYSFPLPRRLAFFGLPAFVGLAAFAYDLLLTKEAAQLLGVAVTVFSALFFAVLVPIAELRRVALQKRDEQHQTYAEFLGHALAGVRFGLLVSVACFVSLFALAMVSNEKSPNYDVNTNRLLSAISAWVVTQFGLTVFLTIKDTFTAYTYHPK